MSEPSKEVQRLQSEVALHEERLRNAESRLRVALIEDAPFKPGDEVTVNGKPAVIRRVGVEWGRVRYTISDTKKKDGTWSTREKGAYGAVKPASEVTE